MCCCPTISPPLRAVVTISSSAIRPMWGARKCARCRANTGTSRGGVWLRVLMAWTRCGPYWRQRGRILRMTASWSWKSATPSARCSAPIRSCRLFGRRLSMGGAGVFLLNAEVLDAADRSTIGVAGNTFGRIFTVTSFGESHGPALGCVVDGCPPGLELCEADLQVDVDRRRPGTSQFTSQRHEPDTVRILSGRIRGQDHRHADRHCWSQTKISARATTRRSRTAFAPDMPTTPINRNTAFATIAAAAAPRRARPWCVWRPAPSHASFCANGCRSSFTAIWRRWARSCCSQ